MRSATWASRLVSPMAVMVHGDPRTLPPIATPLPACVTGTPVTTRRPLTSIASEPAAMRLLMASCRSSAVRPLASTASTMPGPRTGTRPSIARSLCASAARTWSAAPAWPDCRVVRRQRHVRQALEGEVQLELDLARPDVRQRRVIVERRLHPVAVADRVDLDRRGRRRALVDDDLADRTRERRERGDAAAVDRHALGALGEEKVHHVLDVLEVDEVAGLRP